MVSVRVEVRIDARPEDTWAAIADVAAVHERLLPDRVAAARMEGDVRILTMPDRTEVRELVVAIDHETRRMAYAVQSGQRMALAHHHASFEVLADVPGDSSRLVWITDILPHTFEAAVRTRAEQAVVEMKAVIEAAASAPGDASSEKH